MISVALLCAAAMASPLTVSAAGTAAQATAPASQLTVKGTVVDASGTPVVGATVMEKGTRNGAATDVNGAFSLKVTEGATLEISFLGYETQQVKAAATVKVTLKEDTEQLDDVVVVGYGTMKKSDLTGSTVSVRTDAINITVAGNPIEALQGKSTGFAVFTDNEIGSSPTVRVRGTASITASNDPLYVVDGFPLFDADISDINAADIASMEILKDASATAIYGSRGANGVVMITTKQGAEGHKNVNFHATAGIQTPTRLIETISGQDFIDYMKATYAQQGSSDPFTTTPTVSDVDWQKETLSSSAGSQDYGVSLDGASKDTKYMISAGYFNQDGLLQGNSFEKYTAHSNIQHDFNKYITVGANMQFAKTNTNRFYEEVLNDIFRYGWPTDPVYNADGSYNIIKHGEAFNSIASLNNQRNEGSSIRFLGNFFAQVNFTEHLNYRLNIGYDVRDRDNYQWVGNQGPRQIEKNQETGSGMQKSARNQSKLMDNIITYSNKWGDHRMSLTGVYSWQDYEYNYTQMSGNFSNQTLEAYNFANVDTESLTTASDKYGNRLISWTARGTYAYADKYLLTATVRFDGSSRFGADSKWGTFPSVGLGWRATEEDFLKDNPVLTNLKIRASYGVTGNQEIGNYKSLSTLSSTPSDAYYTDGTNALQGYYESVGNSNLCWERTKQFDAGFDLQLIDRINLVFDYYNRNTDNLLYEVPIPSTSGYSTVLSNVGEVNNHGFEVALNADIVRTKDWLVNFGVNYTYNTNSITKLYGDVESVTIKDGFTTTGLAAILKVGEPVNGVYARHSMGIIKTQEELDDYVTRVPGAAGTAHIGSEMYEDVDGDGQITIKDAKCIGSIEPKHFYGLNLSVKYKQFALNVYGQGAWDYASMAGAEDNSVNGSHWAVGYKNIGNYSLWADNDVRNVMGLPSKEAYANMFNAETNPDGTYPSAGAKGIFLSDRTNANWAYFILKNVQLSYNFGKLINTKAIKDLTLNVNFQNFATWANHSGYNPENGDVSNPYAKTILFGLSAKF